MYLVESLQAIYSCVGYVFFNFRYFTQWCAVSRFRGIVVGFFCILFIVIVCFGWIGCPLCIPWTPKMKWKKKRQEPKQESWYRMDMCIYTHYTLCSIVYKPALSEDLLLTELLSTLTFVLSFFSDPSAFLSSTYRFSTQKFRKSHAHSNYQWNWNSNLNDGTKRVYYHFVAVVVFIFQQKIPKKSELFLYVVIYMVEIKVVKHQISQYFFIAAEAAICFALFLSHFLCHTAILNQRNRWWTLHWMHSTRLQ